MKDRTEQDELVARSLELAREFEAARTQESLQAYVDSLHLLDLPHLAALNVEMLEESRRRRGQPPLRATS